MGSRFLSHIGFRAAIALGLAFSPMLLAERLGDLTPHVPITVDGRLVDVAPGTTFAEAIRSLDLHPRAGRLLDVQGDTIDLLSPGRILLNGWTAPPSTVLSPGDTLLALDGLDRTEGTKRVSTLLPGRQPSDPQFNLGTSRVVRITKEGRISGRVVSVTYRPVGKVTLPPAVALTFDDGPFPRSSRKILAILERMQVKATFFMIGYLAERYPGIVRNVLGAGMSIGNHSWDHPNSPPFKRLAPRRTGMEMSRMSGLMQRQFGVHPGLFRPPGGSFNPSVIATARRLGMRIVLWDVDPRDWSRSATARSIVAHVLHHVRPGSIVDLHDGGGDRSATIRALPRIVRGIRRMGLRLVAIST